MRIPIDSNEVATELMDQPALAFIILYIPVREGGVSRLGGDRKGGVASGELWKSRTA